MSFDRDPFNHGSSFDLMFTIMPIFMILFFALFIGILVFNIVKGARRWSYNNKQPVLSVNAKVVSKRSDISSRSHHRAGDAGHHHHTYTYYYVTFEVESGDRMELEVMDQEFGLLVEGDAGKLTFQGTRYHGFERNL